MDLSVMRKGLVIDTGPLTLYAFSTFQGGRYLSQVLADIPRQDAKGVAQALQNLFGFSRKVFVTAYVIAEFHAIARTRAGLDRKGLSSLMELNIGWLAKLDEAEIAKNALLGAKGTAPWLAEALELCFTDTSLILTSQKEDVPILTMDGNLISFCQKLNIPAFHLYYDCYLTS